jgi:hypothetical protein
MGHFSNTHSIGQDGASAPTAHHPQPHPYKSWMAHAPTYNIPTTFVVTGVVRRLGGGARAVLVEECNHGIAGRSVFSATNKAICRIWNITIYRLVVMSETIHRTVHRKMKERENLHDGIWIIIPAPTVVPGQVLLDRHPGTLYRVHDSPVQL